MKKGLVACINGTINQGVTPPEMTERGERGRKDDFSFFPFSLLKSLTSHWTWGFPNCPSLARYSGGL